MNFRSDESIVKLRGGYYTPPLVAQFLTRWIMAAKPRHILEPSCGDGVFISSLATKHKYKLTFTGIEIDPEEAAKSRQCADNDKLMSAQIVNGDFLAWAIGQLDRGVQYDAVLGNPPYIRYQYLNEPAQKLAEEIFARFDLPFTRHTNAWVPFVIASLYLLRPGGRLAMVIPSEILHVLHATSLRHLLLAECDRVLIIDPNELLFREALQGTVLLMAEKKESHLMPSRGVAVVPAPTNSFLDDNPQEYFSSAKYVSGDILNGKWMKVLLSSSELKVFEKIRRLPRIRRFVSLASVDVGIVTGANKFFLVTDATVEQYGLEPWVRPMFGRSEHCPGVIYDKATHSENRRKGLPTNFLLFGDEPRESLPEKVQEYLQVGERQLLHKRYKTGTRSPWYKVPSVYATDVGMLKRSHHYPRLILNTAHALTTDTAYRIVPTNIDPKLFVYCFVNSLTALTAELEGRHYGGGVLELVPSEIEKLLIPVPRQSDCQLSKLDSLIRDGTEAGALLRHQDQTILKDADISVSDGAVLHAAWHHIRLRRHRLVSTSPVGKQNDDE